jgi:hypothetical protein
MGLLLFSLCHLKCLVLYVEDKLQGPHIHRGVYDRDSINFALYLSLSLAHDTTFILPEFNELQTHFVVR